MMKFESTNNEEEKNNIKEEILSNPAFIRFAGGFELYQDLLHNNDNEDNKDLITERMLNFHTLKLNDTNEETEQSSKNEELSQIIDLTIQECQKNNFSKDNFADKLISSSIIHLFLSEWNRQTEEIEKDSNMIHVNELVAYKKENDDKISLHIRPTGTKNTKLISQIINGFQKIAIELETEKIKTDEIIMKSWLFNEKTEKRTKQLFGDEILIENTSSNDNDVIAIQHLALQYNNKSLKKYLETGKKPEVKQIVMTKNEFVTRFKK